MKLIKLHIDNYKILQDLDMDFTDKENNPLPIIVIAGINGSGKTTILEYIYKTFEYDFYDLEGSLTVDIKDLNLTKLLDKFKIKGHISKNIINIYGDNSSDIGYAFYKKIIYLPVNQSLDDIKKIMPLYIENMIYEEDARASEIHQRVRDDINIIFKDLNISMEFDTRNGKGDLFFRNKKGEKISIDDLSTGEKTLISKILYLYIKKIEDSIILIDEPELSLHPAWQNQVLKLYENFAKVNNCQIIIATHSPHIIGSAKNEWIRILTENGVIDNFSKSYGLEFSKVLTDIMGVDNLRTPDVEKDFKFIKKEIYSNHYRDNPEFEKVWKHLEENLENNDIDLDAWRHDFELMKKMIFSYENIEKEEFQETWDRLEKNLGKSDLDLKLLRLEMKFRDK